MTAITVPSLRLDGQVVIVSGASSGLGYRFSQVLHAAGASVVASARRADRLEELRQTINDDDHFAVVEADVTSDDHCERVVAEAIDRFGALNVLVNNAGAGEPMAAEDEPADHFRAIVDVNLNGLFVLTQTAARHMLDQGHGVVVNIASMLGLVGSAPVKQASYCASKGAVINLTRELAVQWARRGVRVNAIAPGWFPSEMAAAMFDDPASMAFVARNCPMARGGEPDELDGTLLFLCSPTSSYCTGQTIVIDGGWTAR